MQYTLTFFENLNLEPSEGDTTSTRAAKAHLNADYRNAVIAITGMGNLVRIWWAAGEGTAAQVGDTARLQLNDGPVITFDTMKALWRHLGG